MMDPSDSLLFDLDGYRDGDGDRYMFYSAAGSTASATTIQAGAGAGAGAEAFFFAHDPNDDRLRLSDLNQTISSSLGSLLSSSPHNNHNHHQPFDDIMHNNRHFISEAARASPKGSMDMHQDMHHAGEMNSTFDTFDTMVEETLPWKNEHFNSTLEQQPEGEKRMNFEKYHWNINHEMDAAAAAAAAASEIKIHSERDDNQSRKMESIETINGYNGGQQQLESTETQSTATNTSSIKDVRKQNSLTELQQREILQQLKEQNESIRMELIRHSQRLLEERQRQLQQCEQTPEQNVRQSSPETSPASFHAQAPHFNWSESLCGNKSAKAGSLPSDFAFYDDRLKKIEVSSQPHTIPPTIVAPLSEHDVSDLKGIDFGLRTSSCMVSKPLQLNASPDSSDTVNQSPSMRYSADWMASSVDQSPCLSYRQSSSLYTPLSPLLDSVGSGAGFLKNVPTTLCKISKGMSHSMTDLTKSTSDKPGKSLFTSGTRTFAANLTGISQHSRSSADLASLDTRKVNRLARKAELARDARRKKKQYMQELEKRVQQLSERIQVAQQKRSSPMTSLTSSTKFKSDFEQEPLPRVSPPILPPPLPPVDGCAALLPHIETGKFVENALLKAQTMLVPGAQERITQQLILSIDDTKMGAIHRLENSASNSKLASHFDTLATWTDFQAHVRLQPEQIDALLLHANAIRADMQSEKNLSDSFKEAISLFRSHMDLLKTVGESFCTIVDDSQVERLKSWLSKNSLLENMLLNHFLPQSSFSNVISSDQRPI